MLIRRFNQKGIATFRDFLGSCREHANAAPAQELLTDKQMSEPITPQIEIEQRPFKTKRDAAVYLHDRLGRIPKEALINDDGLWSWLSLFYFDVICPTSAGQRKVRNDYTYIFESKSMRHFYRHLLFISWRILDVAPKHNRLLLDSSISVLDKFSSEVMKRLYLTRIPCFFEVLDRIYWEPELGRSRKGVVDAVRVTAGDLSHRLPLRIRQLEKTYDLQSLTADALIELLGDEFRFNDSLFEGKASMNAV